MQVKDLQFPNCFFNNEVRLSTKIIDKLLNVDIVCSEAGNADEIIVRNSQIHYHNPTSISKFLFNIMYCLLKDLADDDLHKDKLALGLFQSVKNYIYADINSHQDSIPILYSIDKTDVPFMIISEIIEPLVGKLEKCKVLSIKCKFTDAARVISSLGKMKQEYHIKNTEIKSDAFPIIIANSGIKNEAAVDSHVLAQFLFLRMGIENTKKILKNIVLDLDNSHILNYVMQITRNAKQDPNYTPEFINYLLNIARMTDNEKEISFEKQREFMVDDRHFKTASDGWFTPQVYRQWSQWSMLMGLIEKQLSPMRGSMWPTTELVGPHENRLRAIIEQDQKDKNKNQLNFEELLDSYRKMYNHNAIEPGKLVESLLKDNRVW